MWSADGGTPSLGNGALFGKFSRIGTTIHYLGRLNFGSTTNTGTTMNWKFSLPINLVDASLYTYLGIAYIRNAGIGTHMRTIDLEKGIDDKNILQFLQMDDNTNKLRISYNAPTAFGDGDFISWDVWYSVDGL